MTLKKITALIDQGDYIMDVCRDTSEIDPRGGGISRA